MPGAARPQTVWTLGRAVLVATLALVSAPPAPAGATGSRAAASQDGWWSRLQGPAESEPEGNPIRPVVPTLPKPPTVPADAIAAGATAGQVDKVAAVGIDLTLADGSELERLVLRLAESPEPGANLGADGAKVLACPATIPWGPGQNAAWQDRPEADCGLGSAEGARSDDGTWVFDLSAIARLWADPFVPLAPYGVVLTVDPSASPSAQVSWLNREAGKVVVELAAAPGPPSPPVDAGGPAPGPLNAAGASSSPASPEPSGAGPSADTVGAAPPGPRAATGPTPATRGTGGFPDQSPSTQAPPEAGFGSAVASTAPGGPAPPGARPAVGFWENVSGPTALLVPVTAGLALLVGVVLGPAGRPVPALRREGGLSRALARRGAAGSSRAATR